MNRTPILTINPDIPRITVLMRWGSTPPEGEIMLYVKRVGDSAEFAMYPPISVEGSKLDFQFDDLLFMRPQGRYEGRLVIGLTDYGTVQLQYSNAAKIIGVTH